MAADSAGHGPPTDEAFAGLRVLMLTPSYLPRSGGVERHIRYVVRELSRAGLDIRLATPKWEPDWPEESIDEGVAVTRLSLNAREGRRQLAPLVDWADVVHTHDAYPFLKYYLTARIARPGKPVFATFHGYEGWPVPLEAKLLRRVVLWLTRGNVCAGAFIPKWYRFRCTHVTHGGVDAPRELPPPGEGAVFAGRLAEDTGFLTYLEALRVLKQEHGIDLAFTVCGDGPLRNRGEAFAREHHLSVTFLGFVPDVMPHLASARFAFVSGLLAMLEAMASNAVVLAVYDTPIKEDYLRLFPGAEHIRIAASGRELADQLSSLLAAPEHASQISRAGAEFAREQTWRRVAELYLDLYRPFVRGRARV